MNILHIIDSLEINGGSMMCFELASAMRSNYKDVRIECLVVSKTGKYGRSGITADRISDFYGWKIKSITYGEFSQSIDCSDQIVIHHRLQCTKPLTFKTRPLLYLVVNHTIQEIDRIAQFSNADVVVSVCQYLRNQSPKIKPPHEVILNGVGTNNLFTGKKTGFYSGRCHRLPAAKFAINSLSFLDGLKIPNHSHFIMGPDAPHIEKYVKKTKNTCVRYLGKVDNQEQKLSLIKSFDVYFYDTYSPEGASVAILEGLSSGIPVLCKPLGGNKELVLNGVNGFHYDNFEQAKRFFLSLYEDQEKLESLKKSVKEDFAKRLNIDICAQKYIDLIKDKT